MCIYLSEQLLVFQDLSGFSPSELKKTLHVEMKVLVFFCFFIFLGKQRWEYSCLKDEIFLTLREQGRKSCVAVRGSDLCHCKKSESFGIYASCCLQSEDDDKR